METLKDRLDKHVARCPRCKPPELCGIGMVIFGAMVSAENIAARADVCPHCGRLNKLQCGCNEAPKQ